MSTSPEREGQSVADTAASTSGLSTSSFGKPLLVDDELRVLASSPATSSEGEHLGVVIVELRADSLPQLLRRHESLGESAQIFVGRAEGNGIQSLDPAVESAGGSGLAEFGFNGDSRFASAVSGHDDVFAWVQPLNYQPVETAN